MKIVLLGAGTQAHAIAFDIAQNPAVRELVIGDLDEKLPQALITRLRAQRITVHPRLTTLAVDATSRAQVERVTRGAQCLIGCTTYKHNLGLAEAAIAAGASFCDLGGNVDVVAAQHALDADARKAGVTVIPDCGLAPGMVNILAYHWAGAFKSVDDLQIRVGGLPQKPQTMLNYQLLFSVEGLINEYIEDCEVLRAGKLKVVPGMSGVEHLAFPPPYARLEAFYTSGGASTLPKTLAGRVKNLDYKTIRYAGHAAYIRFLLELGMFKSEPVEIDGAPVVPRRLSAKLLQKYLPQEGADAVLIRVTLTGKVNGQRVRIKHDCIDTFDKRTGLSAMQRTTGFPVAIVAQMLASGSIARKGTVAQEIAVEGDKFLLALAERKIRFQKRRSVVKD